jgi:hypothetical protein
MLTNRRMISSLDLKYSDFRDLRFPQTVPSWFVQQHGDKFRKSVILRTEASTKVTWHVTLTIHMFTSSWIQVRFCNGWKDFITCNGLVEGDSLVFALVAMSEFEVYVFRKEGPLCSQAQIRNDYTRSWKRTTQSHLQEVGEKTRHESDLVLSAWSLPYRAKHRRGLQWQHLIAFHQRVL